MKEVCNCLLEYTLEEDGAAILRCRSEDVLIRLPEQIEGCPVTRIGPYAFSPAGEGKITLPAGTRTLWLHEEALASQPPEAPCAALEEIFLPEMTTEIGNYAFYNCRSLRRLHLSDRAVKLGTGMLMNCFELKRIEILHTAGKKSGVHNLGMEVQQEMEIQLDFSPLEGPGAVARLSFPEYYEEAVENKSAALAKSFDYYILGAGYRYRQCTQDGEVNFSEYDSIFPTMYKERNPDTVVKLAVNRLEYPYELSKEHRRQYEAYLSEHMEDAASLLLEQDDLPRLQLLGRLGVYTADNIGTAIDLASRKGKTECLSYLLDYKNSHFAVRQKTFKL